MMDETTRAADEQKAIHAARVLLRNLTRCFGRGLRGHDLPTTQAAINLRMALDALDADGGGGE